MAKSKKQIEFEQQLGELTQDLQRTRADFENYRKRVELEKAAHYQAGQEAMIGKMLSIFDSIDLAIAHQPAELADNKWAIGVTSVGKKLEKLFEEFKLTRLTIVPGETEFNPDLHHAVSTDEGEGEVEIVSEVLQPGYALDGNVVRPAMVRVGYRKADIASK